MSKKSTKSDLGRIDKLRDDDIDYSDIPELDEAFFANATLQIPDPKASVTIRLDRDVVEWFKSQGKGYQTRMNAALRLYMSAHKPNRNRRNST